MESCELIIWKINWAQQPWGQHTGHLTSLSFSFPLSDMGFILTGQGCRVD